VTLHREIPAPIPERAEVPERKPSRGSAAYATYWTLGGEAGSHAVRLLSSLVLTRLLFPDAFGIMAVINVFMYGLNMFSDLGIRPIIIRHERGDDPSFLNTVWTVRLIRGMILWTASGVIAWPVSRVYGQPILAYLIPVVGLNLVLDGFLSTKFYTRERHLHLARPTMISLGSSLFGVALMIVLAWKFRSVWALVCGGVGGTLVRVLMSHLAIPGPNNRFHWDRTAWREVAHFGKWVFLTSLVTFLAMQMDKLVFAKLIPLGMLGVYVIATNIVRLPTEAVLRVGSSVAFPAFSRARERAGDLAGVFDRMRLLLLLGGGMSLSFLIFNGPWLIALLYDPRYVDAGWILQIAAIGGWFEVLEASHGYMLLTLGQPKWLAAANASKAAAMAVVVPPVFLAFGFLEALAAISVIEGVRYVIESARVRKSGLINWGYERGTSVLMLGCGLSAMLINHGPWRPGGALLRGALSFAVFTAVWSAVAVWYFRKKSGAAWALP
jgi:O-antigen/teichoic acid export membrane protein